MNLISCQKKKIDGCHNIFFISKWKEDGMCEKTLKSLNFMVLDGVFKDSSSGLYVADAQHSSKMMYKNSKLNVAMGYEIHLPTKLL